MNSSTTDYSTIALRVATFLKEGGRPHSEKEIYEKLFPEGVPILYANFSHNILQKCTPIEASMLRELGEAFGNIV